MTYRLFIFDFDGTLADSLPWLTTVMNQLATRYRFRPIPEGELELLRGLSASEIIKRVGVPVWRTPFIAAHVRSLMNAHLTEIPLFEGVNTLLPALSQAGATLAIVSSNSWENVRTVLGPANAELISHVECGVSMFGKASRLKKVLAKTGVPAAEAIYIGDEIRDIEAARTAKMAAGAVSWGYNTVESLKGHDPTFVFQNIADIAALVRTGEETHRCER